eukprot:TRINITY_DN4493_c0_g2_i2.p1 TRINITY_DN4493_c0_g2~~TRINITY_DN4493_c0_g2_i2.p1  ORF type:complete len:263 (-),score=60.11 TRINITY_DN4493_c0_g2_i2:219-1007(-)
MQQLKQDFDKLLSILELTRTRERIKQAALAVQQEVFDQAVYDLTNTSGEPRQLNIKPGEFKLKMRPPRPVVQALENFDEAAERLKKKKKKDRDKRDSRGEPSTGQRPAAAAVGEGVGEDTALLPSFMDNFMNRTKASMSGRVEPALPAFTVRGICEPVTKFRCRGRIGRGGRVVFDRVPVYEPENEYSIEPEAYVVTSSVPHKYEVPWDVLDLEHISANCPRLAVNEAKLQEVYMGADDQDETLLDPQLLAGDAVLQYQIEV